MLFPVITAISGNHNPDSRISAVLQPLSFYWGISATNPFAVGVAVRCEVGRGAFATPSFSPACLSTQRKAEKRPTLPPVSFPPEAARISPECLSRVFSRPRLKNRHTRRHGGSQGATSASSELLTHPRFRRYIQPPNHPSLQSRR